MKEDGIKLHKGDVIRAELEYVLRAPDGRRIPIPTGELAEWIDRYYKPGLNKRKVPTLYVRNPAEAGMWNGGEVEGTPLRCGSWSILQSDEAVEVIPQMHTAPIARLRFSLAEGNTTVRASFAENRQDPPEEKEKTPTGTATKQVPGESH